MNQINPAKLQCFQERPDREALKYVRTPITLEEALFASIGNTDRVLIHPQDLNVLLVRFGHTETDHLRKFLSENAYDLHKLWSLRSLCSNELPDYYGDSTMVTGRSIKVYVEYLPEGKTLLQRLATNRDRLYLEIGAGFSELIVDEAVKRHNEKGVRPVVIDDFDQETCLALLRYLQSIDKGMAIDTPRSPLPASRVIEILNILCNPDFVNRINYRFIHASLLPEHAAETIRESNGIHTLVDYQAVRLALDVPDFRGMQKLLANDGKVYSN